MLHPERLNKLHLDLLILVNALAQEQNFTVVEGLRTAERQKWLLAQKKTTTLNSRHLTGHAVDIAPLVDGKPSWDWQHFYPLAEAFKLLAREHNIPIEWGGDWKTFKDGAHWQLPWKEYPVTNVTPAEIAAAQAAVNDLNAKLATAATANAAPAVRGKTAGFRSSEFWVTMLAGIMGVVDQVAGTSLMAAGGPIAIAYVIGRPVLKSVLVAAEAYVSGKQALP